MIEGVLVGVLVNVLVKVIVGVLVGVAVAVGVLVLVRVFVRVFVGVRVGVLVGVRVVVGVPGVGVLVGVMDRTAAWTAANASRMPKPLSRSTPNASMSIAVEVRIVLICVEVRLGFSDLTRAAMAPACGAAAEVPKKVLNPGAAQLTPSAAVMSGWFKI